MEPNVHRGAVVVKMKVFATISLGIARKAVTNTGMDLDATVSFPLS